MRCFVEDAKFFDEKSESCDTRLKANCSEGRMAWLESQEEGYKGAGQVYVFGSGFVYQYL